MPEARFLSSNTLVIWFLGDVCGLPSLDPIYNYAHLLVEASIETTAQLGVALPVELVRKEMTDTRPQITDFRFPNCY